MSAKHRHGSIIFGVIFGLTLLLILLGNGAVSRALPLDRPVGQSVPPGVKDPDPTDPHGTGGAPSAIDAFHVISPCNISVTQGTTFTLDLLVNAGTNQIVSQQAYLTFTNALLQVVSPGGGCAALATTVEPDTSSFEASLQNTVNNATGEIAYASGTFGAPRTGQFRVARLHFCATGTGSAQINWQFSPPAPPQRNTGITDAQANRVENRALYSNCKITIVGGATATPTRTNTAVPPTATNTAVPPTVTNTAVPATATRTNTPVPPTATNTPVPPTATRTNTPVPPTATNTGVPPTATNTVVPPTVTRTNTPAPPTATNTVAPPTATRTNTVVVPTNTATNTPTNTPVVPTATRTNTPTNTAVVPTNTATNTPTNTAIVPTRTSTNTPTNTAIVPTRTPTNTPTNTAIVPTRTPTNTPTNTAIVPTRTPTNTPTNTPVQPTPTGTVCPGTPTRIPTPNFTPAPGCGNPDPDDLGAEIAIVGNTSVAEFTNYSRTCSYPIGLAVYKRFNNNIDDQELYNYTLAVIPPNSTLTLTVVNPPCSFQTDAFWGPVLFSLNGQRYGSRLLDDVIRSNGGFCTPGCNSQTVARTTR